MKYRILVAAMTAATAGAAYADQHADANWSGFYLGTQVGGAFNPDDAGELDFDGPGDIDSAFGDNFEGEFQSSFQGGFHAGYDHQMDRTVIGVVVDTNFTNIEQRQSAFSATPATYSEVRTIEYLVSGRLRAGYLVTPKFLPYITGGVAWGDIDYRFDTDTPANVREEDADRDGWGYTLGAGFETLITDNLSIGAEYLYTDLGKNDFSTNLSAEAGGGQAAFGNAASGGTDTEGSDGNFDFHSIAVKLSYRYN